MMLKGLFFFDFLLYILLICSDRIFLILQGKVFSKFEIVILKNVGGEHF